MAVSLPVITSTGQIPCPSPRECFYDGFNYTDYYYLSEPALASDCVSYCAASPNIGGGSCAGVHHSNFNTQDGTGYCQCLDCS